MNRRGLPLEVAPAAILLILLAAQLPADPATGVTFSNSPITDEGWNALGARNLVLLGDPGAGNWVLYLVQLPFTALEAAGFALFGVGIVQARLVTLACSVATVALVGLAAGRAFGRAAGLAAASALAASSLVLYYGRLVYLEDLVMLALAGGAVLLCWPGGDRGRGRALLAGALLAVAIGTKPSAIFPVLGVLAGMPLAVRTRASAAHALLALAAIAVLGLAWGLVVALPRPDAIHHVLEIWAAEKLPANGGELVDRILAFPLADSIGSRTWPLAAGAVAGLIALVARWRRLDDAQRRLAGAAVGWLVVGLAFLLVASYRPNRYAVPLLPAAALLTAFVIPVVWAAAAAARARLRLAVVVLACAAAGALLLPGLRDYASWVVGDSQRLPGLQQRFAEAADGRPIQGGLAATLAMRVPAPIFVDWTTTDLNDGDLYADAGVRWVVGVPTFTPGWADAHPAAWAARDTLFCVVWGKGERCLVRIP